MTPEEVDETIVETWRRYITDMNRASLGGLAKLAIKAWVETEGVRMSRDADAVVSIPVERDGRPETIVIPAADFQEL